MESGAIPDRDITASSYYDAASVGPQHGRLRNDKNGGAWCPKKMVDKEATEYLEVNLHVLHVITGTKTQGRFGNGQGQEYAEEFMLEYWRPGSSEWVRWRNRSKHEILTGNTNTYTEEQQVVDPPIRTNKIRFIPYSEHQRTVCMRVELLGCRSPYGLVSYSMIQGVQRGSEVDLTDRTYDGLEENGRLSEGLGQLADGERGADNFRLDLHGKGKGYEWVGWRNDTPEMIGRPVEITFEFDRVRNFSAMHIHTNNMYTKDVQVFSRAQVYFSNGGKRFSSIPVSYSYIPDLVMEHARNVTIKLHHRLGRFVKLELYFANRWILISEVRFDSVITDGNFTDEEPDNRVEFPSEENGLSKGYPLQRDDIQTVSSRDDQKQYVVPPLSSFNDSSEPKQYIGLVIGALSTVILILVAAIMFIVFRNQRLRTVLGGATNTVLPGGFVGSGPGRKGVTINMKDFQMRVNLNANGHVYGQVSLDDPEEKSAIYHEPFNMNLYAGLMPGRKKVLENGPPVQMSQDLPAYEASDLLNRNDDYAVPQICESPRLSSGRAPPPSLHNFFPKPPLVPPPSEKYYAATEICKQKSTPEESNPAFLRVSHLPGHQTLSLPKFLSDNNTDSEFPVTETEDEGCYEDISVPLIVETQLKSVEQLGYGQFGEVKLCRLTGKSDFLSCKSNCELVAVKTLRSGSSDSTKKVFRNQVKVLSRINDANIIRVLGACLSEEPIFVVFEYTAHGDLNQFLQEHVADTTTPLPTNAKTLSYGCLIYMATQIASGMKYLESLNFIHRDLAARNCLVGTGYKIKVTDLGMSRSLYSADYYQVGGDALLPIRWMSWESVLLEKFTTKSDVWSFAVTLWEILTFAREQPFEEMCDEKVIENVRLLYQDTGKHVLLHQPKNCPKEIYDLMRECWQRNESDRPNFREIHLFLQRKNLGYDPATG
ncbi:hypothetical protein RUM43_002682 [Polyplax serrata]|uniref:Discoidin domain-containing receptor 2-like n=1 Tax=Polyplax serrata TaxID=468196 RepID=A0AAN8S2R8_POLSC